LEIAAFAIIMERLNLDTQLRLIGMLDEHDLLCLSLASKAFHGLVRARCKDGIKTPPSVICSSVKRMRWIKDEYPGEKPWWLTPKAWNQWTQGVFGGTYFMIADHGSLEVLQWAAAQGCPLLNKNGGFGLCAIAAERGHLEILKWARLQGCEWGPVASRLAALEGHIEMRDHLRDEGCEFPADDVNRWRR
jgi:hypothetical protein